MENVWLESALWLGLALLASIISIRLATSVALIEIMVGAVAGNLIGLQLTDWVNFLAGFGAILLTFLAGTEIDSRVIRKHFWSSVTVGVVGFLAPYVGVLLYARYVIDWSWPQAQIAGISLSTTSVAVVYAVMVETGFNKTEIGKIILAACFVNDLGTVLALGVVFAHFDLWLAVFGAITAVALWLLPRFAPWFFKQVSHRVSEPETKFISLILLGLGGLASIAGSEAVLPAYLVGMALAPVFLADAELPHRMRIIAFTILTPFYFLKAGSLVDAHAVIATAGLIAVLLAIKMATKFIGILPLTRAFRFNAREGMYTTLLMSTGLTFGTISALFGLTNRIIDQQQYTILVTAVIGSAVIPTLIAQRWFQPAYRPLNDETVAATQVPAEETYMYEKILIADDGSEGAAKALSAAIELARRLKATLHMISVEEMPRFPSTVDEVVEEKREANRRFDQIIERARTKAKTARVKFEAHVVTGHAVPSIIEFIERQGCDLLVIGYMGHSALYNRVIGSTTDRLVEFAPCQVLVVK